MITKQLITINEFESYHKYIIIHTIIHQHVNYIRAAYNSSYTTVLLEWSNKEISIYLQETCALSVPFVQKHIQNQQVNTYILFVDKR